MIPGTALINFLLALLLLAATAVLFVLDLPDIAVLFAISILCVVSIIFGERLEIPLRNLLRLSPPEEPQARSASAGWSRIAETLTAREALLPVGVMAGLMLFGYVSIRSFEDVFFGKIEIIFLILTFAVISYGIKQSGYFKYAAFRVLEVCDGQITRMTLYLFLVSFDSHLRHLQRHSHSRHDPHSP